MKKNKLTIPIVLILSLLIINTTASNPKNDNIVSAFSYSSLSSPKLDDLIVQSPMVINYDSDFEAYGLPGDGSAKDPYRIENYNITTTDDACIILGGYTTKHFTIDSCFLKTETNSSIIIGKYVNLNVGRVVISNNVIISTSLSGSSLKIKGTLESGAYHNNIISLDCGVEIEESFTYVKNNYIVAALGVRLVDSLSSSIIGNICNETSEIGLKVENSNGTIITQNTFSNHVDTGILVEDSHSLEINNNYVEDNFYGVRIIGSSGCTINNNLFDSSTSFGLSMSLSTGLNKIYHNAFYNNNLGGSNIQANDDAGDQWYHEVLLEGNFWNDFSGSTSSSYTIDGTAGSEDPYPLGYVPTVSEYSNGYFSILLITMLLAIPLVLFKTKKK